MAPKTELARDVVTQGAEALAAAGISSSLRESRRLFALAAGSAGGVLDLTGPVPSAIRRRYWVLVGARRRRVPVPLLEGETGFLDFDLRTRPGVFVPRPETEELADRARSVLSSLPPQPRVLDLGTGTGALAIALARQRADASVVAVDVSPRALSCARRNVRLHGLQDRVEVRRSDWFANVPETFHVIVGNPPYVRRGDLRALEPEVGRYEPLRALDGGWDGLAAIREIVASAPAHLFSGGTLLLEIGAGQGATVLEFAGQVPGWVETSVERDWSNRERFFRGRCG
ncbi:MAG: Peptide chain release factor N(5)-glutamine methyltransferase [Candidatus Bipolaricaulis sibiricus]|uniref:peptide chain release factor N(5)-glutamine methyltransferase n=1 Tax=Bipolaricaulis sibiricus TaxID=2501609 RepID=A0A410FVJ0_BIPS1|nr:MAG: Peptide chain release factor N(5)-glutamine methyltransferase [Candidatus Bipolaricaulis sibiricus]